MASQIHVRCQSGCAKAHLDRSEEMLAQQTAAHEEAEAAVGHCDHMMSEGKKIETAGSIFPILILCFGHFSYVDSVGFFQLATMFHHVCVTCLFSYSFPTTIETYN